MGHGGCRFSKKVPAGPISRFAIKPIIVKVFAGSTTRAGLSDDNKTSSTIA
jgi:hypothetical protein